VTRTTKHAIARVFYAVGGVAVAGGLLWMIWTPVFGDLHDMYPPLAVAWTGCLVLFVGVMLDV
jgi:drug/metabolite transporter superfamily protein YnfA